MDTFFGSALLWVRLDSPPHRRTMLDPDYTQSGLGVHLSREGEWFFTQLFLVPADGT